MNEDRREGGFIVIHRRVRSSRLYRSLTGEQKAVFYEVLLAANWRDDGLVYAGKWVEVKRGQLAHSLETIADRAGVSVKVVRTTYAKLMADDSHLPGGRGPFMVDGWSGGGKGRGLRLLTIVHYDEYQRVGEDEGTAPGTPVGATGARLGHASGTAGAPREPEEQDQPLEPERDPSPAAGEEQPHPPLAPEQVMAACARTFRELRGVPYTVPDERARVADRAAAEELARTGDPNEIRERWEAALCNTGFPRVDTVADLGRFWVRFAPSPAAAQERYRQQRAQAGG